MLRFGRLTIHIQARRVELDGVDIRLSRAEFALLHVLASRPGEALEHREILGAMWGADWQADTTPLQVHVSRLRRKLGESGSAPRHIVTVHGIGYRFEPDPRVMQGPMSTVTLVFDRDHTLLELVPRIPVCGWQPDEIVGRAFSPLVDDPWIGQALILGLLEAGAHEIEGRVALRCCDGRRITVHAATHLEVDARGSSPACGSPCTCRPDPMGTAGHVRRPPPGGVLRERSGNATGPVVVDRA